MNIGPILPWQHKQWDSLWQAKIGNRLPHALLFVGAAGLGKMLFADTFSAAILCEQSALQNKACGVCHACGMVQANSHPDLIHVTPEQPGQMIKIDQIRNVVNTSNETAMQGGYKIIIIHPAQAMNAYAANALLKTLEEATPNTLFILISEQNLRLPLTILSRCQKVVFQKPDRQNALAWLQSQQIATDVDWNLILNLTEGAPLQALSFVEKKTMMLREEIYSGLCHLTEGKADPLQLAAKWQEYDGVSVLNLVLYWLRDLLRMQLAHQNSVLVNQDYQAVFSGLVQRLSPKHLLQYIAIVQERYKQISNLQNLNRQLLFEELLIDWTKCYVSR